MKLNRKQEWVIGITVLYIGWKTLEYFLIPMPAPPTNFVLDPFIFQPIFKKLVFSALVGTVLCWLLRS